MSSKKELGMDTTDEKKVQLKRINTFWENEKNFEEQVRNKFGEIAVLMRNQSNYLNETSKDTLPGFTSLLH